MGWGVGGACEGPRAASTHARVQGVRRAAPHRRSAPAAASARVLTGAAAQAGEGEEQGAERLREEGVQLRQAQLHQLRHALRARVEVRAPAPRASRGREAWAGRQRRGTAAPHTRAAQEAAQQQQRSSTRMRTAQHSAALHDSRHARRPPHHVANHPGRQLAPPRQRAVQQRLQQRVRHGRPVQHAQAAGSMGAEVGRCGHAACVQRNSRVTVATPDPPDPPPHPHPTNGGSHPT